MDTHGFPLLDSHNYEIGVKGEIKITMTTNYIFIIKNNKNLNPETKMFRLLKITNKN